ncbi:MAG: hypothetical protein U0S48_06915 [Solirubrobacteraceae bacterium]
MATAVEAAVEAVAGDSRFRQQMAWPYAADGLEMRRGLEPGRRRAQCTRWVLGAKIIRQILDVEDMAPNRPSPTFAAW